MTLHIVTDSTADVPPYLAQELGISVVPLHIQIGADVYQDGVDLTTDVFFSKLTSGAAQPTTSPPDRAAFVAVYRHLLDAGDEVLSLHLSGKLSATVAVAQAAQQEIAAGPRLAVMDTGLTSLALGLVVLAAARLAQNGKSLAEVTEQARIAAARTHLLLFLEEPEYLQRSGRMGRFPAFLADLLDFKPIIALKDGEPQPVDRVRTRRGAIDWLVEWARCYSNIQEAGVLYSTTPADATALADRLRTALPETPVVLVPYGPVIGAHVGPGGMAIVLREDDPL